jgi:hypothetical protein
VSAHRTPSYDETDPLELPAWLGEGGVTWESQKGGHAGHRLDGALTRAGHDPLPCDLLAVDDAYPEPVAADTTRVRAHRAWRYGEVLVAADGDRLLLAVPGSRLDTETVLAAVERLARAVGAPAGSYAVRLRAATDGA